VRGKLKPNRRPLAATLSRFRRACGTGSCRTCSYSISSQYRAKQDVSQLAWSQAYLTRYEQELPKAANSGALIEAMKKAYPDAGLGIALDIGAKVNKGEMKW
jgi:hypothetical protein